MRPLHNKITSLLVDPYAFRPGDPNGHVTLLGRPNILRAIAMSRYLGALTPSVIRNQLLAGLPESRTQEISASVSDVRTIGRDGWSHLVLSLDCSELETERDASFERLKSLGGAWRLRRDEDPCHVTIGVVDTPLHSSVIDEVAELAPSYLTVGSVLPKPLPADERISQLRLGFANG